MTRSRFPRTARRKIGAPTIVQCNNTGITADGGTVVVACQKIWNKHITRFEQANRKKTKQDGKARTSRVSGVRHNFAAYEPSDDTTGVAVKTEYKWFQIASGTIVIKDAAGNTLGSATKLAHWDGKAAGGGNSYGGSTDTTAQAPTGSSTTSNANGMSDLPSLQVPQTDAEATTLGCDMGLTGANKNNWHTITYTASFETILYNCTANTRPTLRRGQAKTPRLPGERIHPFAPLSRIREDSPCSPILGRRRNCLAN